MNEVIFGIALWTVIHCESDLTSQDRSILRGIAAKIESSPTILKVFIKGDVQEEDIARLLNLSPRDDKAPNNIGHFTRNRRNSIASYIGNLYNFNRLLRPYRSIFRGLSHGRTTNEPWLKKFLGGPRTETKTESFWGMALGAHTFNPVIRPLAHTRTPYHRIRDQKRIDRLLGITRNYDTTNADNSSNFHGIRNQHTNHDKYMVKARNQEETTTGITHTQGVTTRKAYHRAPYDVAGLRTMNFSHLHSITTPRRLKFCEKQCPDEKEEAKTRKPKVEPPESSTEGGQTLEPPEKSTEGGWTESPGGPQGATPPKSEIVTTECNSAEETTECTCTMEVRCGECSREEVKDDCKNMILKRVLQTTTKRKTKTTTWKFTRGKEQRITAPIWTLPPNSVLDKTQKEETQEEQSVTRGLEDETKLSGTTWFAITTKRISSSIQSTGTDEQETTATGRTGTTSAKRRKPKCTCRNQKTLKPCSPCGLHCPHLPIPTRLLNLMKPTRPSATCSSTESTTCTSSESTPCSCTESTPFECQTKMDPSDDTAVTGGEALDNQSQIPNCQKRKAQKIVVRISSALGEVPVVIMRDNGVSGVSLSLVNDYLLDENNRLIKCLSQKPVGRQRGTLLPKDRNFIPQLIRHQLHGLQPRRYSLRFRCKPARKLVQAPRASQGRSRIPYHNPNQIAIPRVPISNPIIAYKNKPPQPSHIDRYGLSIPYFPGLQYPRQFNSFKMQPGVGSSVMLDHPMFPIHHNEFSPRNYIRATDYPRIGINQVPNRLDQPVFQPQGLEPVLPQPNPDTSQIMNFRAPFLPVFYPSKNYIEPPKYIIPAIQ